MSAQKNGGGWYFGWTIVVAASIATLMTVGMRMCISPFFLPIAEDLHLSRSLLSGIIAIGMFSYGLGMPVAGHLVGTLGTRPVLFIGTVMVVVASVWASLAQDAISLLLSFGVLFSLGLSFTSPVAFTPMLSRWFIRRRGMALFFLWTGSMAGIAILTPVFAYAIEMIGWRHTLLGFALVFAAMMLPSIWWAVRDEAPPNADLLPEAVAARPSVASVISGLSWREAVRTRPFWYVTLGFFTCGYSMNLLGTHGVPMLMDHGFDAMTSSYGLGLIGLVAIFSTLVLGRLADALPRRNILAAIYLIRAVGFFLLMTVATHTALYASAVLGGVAWAGTIALTSAILADVYGTRIVGVLYGLAYLSHQLGATISSWLGGWAYEKYGTHWIAFGSAIVFLLGAAAISLRLPANGFSLSKEAAVPPFAQQVST